MMASVQHLIVFSVLVSVTASSDVYKLVNMEVQLDIQAKIDQFVLFKWKFERNNFLRYYSDSKSIKKNDGYKDRLDFNSETLSLTLKNLQKTDSGVYEAEADGAEHKTVARYKLYVLDPVQEPKINSVYQQRSDHCNVTCLGLSILINSYIEKKTCEERKTSTDGVNFTLSLCVNGNQVTCNHSNPAGSKVILNETNKLCHGQSESNSDASCSTALSVCLLKTVLCSVALVFMVSAVITVHIRARLIKPKTNQTRDQHRL